ncbi:MAG: PilN domain-containing protein [Zoogloeaceae bacterium]|jgi:type IV pilus assembly protein PilN|nr:PilN domain-containing protein [Zoogloeaceae bacterium]
MIRLNLLPYREKIRQEKQRQFNAVLVLVVIVGAAIVGLGWGILDAQVTGQLERQEFLRSEITKLEDQIKEIDRLKEEIQLLLNRKNAIESLQGDRGSAVRLLSELVEQTPGGIYLDKVIQAGNVVTVDGYTQSSSRVSVFMRNIKDSDWTSAPQLKEIKADLVNGRPLGKFSMSFTLEKEKKEKPGAGSGKTEEENK